jgi:hypothetical protein
MFNVVAFTVVVVPCTNKLPNITAFLLTVKLACAAMLPPDVTTPVNVGVSAVALSAMAVLCVAALALA